MHEEYTPEFFDLLVKEADEGFAIQLLSPVFMMPWPHKSVIDIGCGIGHWLRACKQLGAEWGLGLDGKWVPRDKLVIDQERFEFEEVDLANPINYEDDCFFNGGKYDLAVCLEVIEHLPPRIGPLLVKALTHSAPAVIFSGAVPGQGGTHHINERPLTYWEGVFDAHNYELLDFIRPTVAGRQDIPSWYRDNIVVFADRGFIKQAQPPQAAK